MNKISYLLNLVLAAALLVLAIKLPTGTETPKEAAKGDMSALECIMTRTSIRSYTAQPVSAGAVDTLLRAAMAAPTAGNKQPWRFVTITERATLDSIAANFRTMRMCAEAPLAILVCGDLDDTFPGEGQAYWIQDASAASENLLLAAHALGLGAVWCGIWPLSERVDWFAGELGLPSTVKPLGLMVVGHPAEDPAPKDKWEPSKVHASRW